MVRYITLLLFIGMMFGQDDLKTVSGKEYKGKYLKIEGGKVFFIPEEASSPAQVPIVSINEIITETGEIDLSIINDPNAMNKANVLAANKPTFINMQTADGIIHYPIIVGVTETDIILDGQTAIPISSINSVTEYGPVNPILPILAGAGLGYFGMLGGVLGAFVLEMEYETLFVFIFLGGGIGAVGGYTMVNKALVKRLLL